MALKDDYLIDILQSLNIVTPKKIAGATKLSSRKAWKRKDLGVVDALLERRSIRHIDVAQAKATHFGAEVVRLKGLSIPQEIIGRLTIEIAQKYRVIPISVAGTTITVAVSDPSDLDTIDSLHHLLRADIELKVASDSEIRNALEHYYPVPRKKK